MTRKSFTQTDGMFDRVANSDPEATEHEPPLPKASDILTEANNLINGPRQSSYGHPSKNLNDIATMWSTLLDTEVTARDVCKMMTVLKLCRDKNRVKRDNIADGIGYLALAEEVTEPQ